MTHPVLSPVLLRAVIDRLIPADDHPSAGDAGCGEAIERLLSGDARHYASLVQQGLAALDQEAQALHGAPFATLGTQDQDHLLTAMERAALTTPCAVDPARALSVLVDLTGETYYSDPGNGGNLDYCAWRMIGYPIDEEIRR